MSSELCFFCMHPSKYWVLSYPISARDLFAKSWRIIDSENDDCGRIELMWLCLFSSYPRTHSLLYFCGNVFFSVHSVAGVILGICLRLRVCKHFIMSTLSDKPGRFFSSHREFEDHSKILNFMWYDYIWHIKAWWHFHMHLLDCRILEF